MTSPSQRFGESEPRISYDHYLQLKRAGAVILIVLVVIGMIGSMYVGTTPWGHALFEKFKHFLTTEMNMLDVIYIALGSLGVCALPCVISCTIRRINICCARPVELDNDDLEEGWESSPTEFDYQYQSDIISDQEIDTENTCDEF